jgi:endogenous inhibitor of DNA gyrase (YacG/DUF329 family)
MITCSECGKPMEKVPLWMASVRIRFVCDNCRKVNPQQWFPLPIAEDEEERIAVQGDEDIAFVEGEVGLEDLAAEERKRLMGDDLFEAGEELPEEFGEG